MKVNKIICLLSSVILGASVLAGCTDNEGSSNIISTTAVTQESTTGVSISKSTSKEELSTKLEKLGVSEELAESFIKKANGSFSAGDVIDFSGIELKDEDKNGFAQLVRLVLDLAGTYDDSTMKFSVDKELKTDLSLSNGVIKVSRELED